MVTLTWQTTVKSPTINNGERDDVALSGHARGGGDSAMAQGQKKNRAVVPAARQALDKFKYEVAHELGIQVPEHGYWGDIPSRLNGAVGGNMVRRMIAAAEQSLIDQATSGVQAGFRQGLGEQPQNPATSYYQPQQQQQTQQQNQQQQQQQF